MLDDTLDNFEEEEELEEEADAEVEKVLFELTDGKLGQAGSVGTELPVSSHPDFRDSSSYPVSLLSPTPWPTKRRTKRWSAFENCSVDRDYYTDAYILYTCCCFCP